MRLGCSSISLLLVYVFQLKSNALDIASESKKKSNLELAQGQVTWIVSHGGYFNPDLKLKLFNEDEPLSSPAGIFTTNKISKGTIIMKIPRTCLLIPNILDSEEEEEEEEEGPDLCDTSKKLIQERQLGEMSHFEPYINYLFDNTGGIMPALPSQFSEEGRNLMEELIGNELPLNGGMGMTDVSFQENCGGIGDELEELAYSIVTRRSWDHVMVPVYDMANHRNGKWYNIESNSIHGDDDISVYATRDIQENEQLYLSYNECTDCIGYAYTYVLQHILRDYGFVEQYPQRWVFFEYEEQGNGRPIVFEIDTVLEENERELSVYWYSQKPDEYQKRLLHGYLTRLKNLPIEEKAKTLSLTHERNTIMEFYIAMKNAINYALIYSNDATIQTLDTVCTATSKYDQLQESETQFIVPFEEPVCSDDTFSYYETMEEVETGYQTLAFHGNDGPYHSDTCLEINNHLNVCTSLRPHYHEVMVHFPASYTTQIKRVCYLGGGDAMLLHEILKYPQLELVVGLELDQGVVRGSFNHFGTQPHFDNPKVEWWFGDASKSLFVMLPQEYYGTFDLVLVDLQSDVIDALEVTDEMSVMGAALRLLNKNGVIARNVDYGFDTTNDFSLYSVDLYYDDVPVYCFQGITVGSNTRDFLTEPPFDHHIDTLYFDPVSKTNSNSKYQKWYNYRKRDIPPLAPLSSTCCDESTTNNNEDNIQPGVVMILEIENVVLGSSTTSTRELITSAISKSELRQTTFKTMNSAMIFLLKEGYVVAHAWPHYSYIGIDIYLWSHFEKQSVLESHLLQHFPSTTPSYSSFRLIRGGMYGSNQVENYCLCSTQEYISKVSPTLSSSSPNNSLTKLSDEIIAESISLIQTTTTQHKPVIAIICGTEDQITRCTDTKAKILERNPLILSDNIKLVTNSVQTSVTSATADGETMLQWFTETLASFRMLVKESYQKINCIIISPQAEKSSGQILHKIFNNTKIQKELLQDKHIILETSMSSKSSAWRKVLLDKFRTDFIIYDPAYRAEITFKQAQKHNIESNVLELGIFSAEDESFYSHLLAVLESIQQKHNDNLVADVRNVINGLNNYVAEFKPSQVFTFDDYDQTDYDKQYTSQNPVGRQSMIHFEMTSSKAMSFRNSLNSSKIKDGLQLTFSKLKQHEGMDSVVFQIHSENDGLGCVISGLWSKGTIVAVWNGKKGIDLHLFTTYHEDSEFIHDEFEDIFVQTMPFLQVTVSEDFPRGFGRVVEFL